MTVFELEVSVLVVPYHESLDSQLHRLSGGRLYLASAETFLMCLCGILSLMCHAAEEWKLRLFNWQLCNVSTSGDPLLLDWEDTFRAPLISGCIRVRSAFESFTEDLTHFCQQMALGRWRDFVEANMQAILHYWYSLENVLSMEEVYSLHRLLTDRMWVENAKRIRMRTCARGGFFPEDVIRTVQAYL